MQGRLKFIKHGEARVGFVGFDGHAGDAFDEIDDVVVGFQGDAGEGEVGVVVDAGLIGIEALGFLGGGGFGEGHLGDVELLPGVEPEFWGNFGKGVGLDGFVVEMPVGEVAAGLGEFLVDRRLLGERDAGQHPHGVKKSIWRYGLRVISGQRSTSDRVEIRPSSFGSILLSPPP